MIRKNAGRMLRRLLGVFILLIVAMPAQLWAKDKVVVAVLPFTVHSAENIDYVQQGILDMLTTRISTSDKVTIVPKETVLDALKSAKSKEVTQANAYSIGKTLNADYTVWGSITKIGNSLSLDGKLLDIINNKTSVDIFSQSQGMDDVITKINDFAQRINQFVSGAPVAAVAVSPVSPAAPSATMPSAATTPSGNQESRIIAGLKSGRRATLTGTINQDFVTGAQPVDKKSFWMSKYPTEFRGLDIGDVNGDGLNEIVTIDNNNVYVFQKKGNDMVLLQKINGKGYEKYLGVDLFSLTGNVAKDILVSNVFTNKNPEFIHNSIQSFVLTWKDGKFVKVADNLPWLFRVISRSGEPMLLGQKLSASMDSPTGTSRPFETPIHEMSWVDGKVAEGKKMKIPTGLCIYGLTMDNLGEGSDKIITLNAYDHINVLEQSDKDMSRIEALLGGGDILYQSDEVFGGSNIALNMYGMEVAGFDTTWFNVYLNPRILTYDTNKDGKREILIARNDASGGRILKNVKFFTSTEFYNFSWDSLGLSENWHTKKMSGYAIDYQIKDVDNDGQDEIVMALVLSGGSLSGGRSSAIVSYKLQAQ
ncbi:MAG: hypothetical protein PHN75_00880 [Syntrophales bacterium]|nr:hypothetical protein [Syntrophales bacterium]